MSEKSIVVEGGNRISQSPSGLMWHDHPHFSDSDTFFKKDVLRQKTIPTIPEEVFFRQLVIVGTLIPKDVLKQSNSKQILHTGMSFSCNAGDNGVTIGGHIFGSVGRIQKIFPITNWRLIVVTELGDMYSVFVEGTERETYEPTTLHAEFPLDHTTVNSKDFESTLFRNKALQVFRLTGNVWKFPIVGKTGQFKTEPPLRHVPPSHHLGVSAGIQAPGAQIGGFITSVHQVSEKTAIAVTESGAIYFISVVK